MKQDRHAKILELIRNNAVGTQEEILAHLKAAGYDVTQATVSRDIRELRLVKTLADNGEYVYATGKVGESGSFSIRFDDLFADSVIHVDSVMNQIVIKCYTGLANAVCAAFDQLSLDQVVGTLSGDDTILIIMRSEESAAALYRELLGKL